MKTLGEKFLKEFINLRETDCHLVTRKIEYFLHKHHIPYKLDDADGLDNEAIRGLLSDFFGTAYILEINPGKTETVLIGKGVCFDTGGYSLKSKMSDMFYDKNGALLAISAAIDNNSSAIVFFVTNFIDNRVVEGQILTDKFTKLKVLIDNTDAEGRIGLAHCIGLAKQRDYKKIITIATLTGQARMITGDRTYAMVHSNNKHDLREVFTEVLYGDQKLELWPAPYHDDYDKAINTKIKGADIRNCGDYKGAGTSTAFSFLKRFSQETPHMHVDMATMSTDKDGNGYIWGIKEITYLLEVLK